MRPVRRNIEALKERKSPRIHRCFIFRRKHVDFCPRKVWQTTSMIDMKMRQYNVLDILWSEAQSDNLLRRCFLQITGNSIDGDKCAYKSRRVSVVSKSQTCINKYESFIRLDEQTMSDALGTKMKSHAIQMVNAHCLTPGSVAQRMRVERRGQH